MEEEKKLKEEEKLRQEKKRNSDKRRKKMLINQFIIFLLHVIFCFLISTHPKLFMYVC